ncbi:MAG: AAA family ATPase [Clostridia bacterium]|nr:AAA family ATPase [Clostridia bacterium]
MKTLSELRELFVSAREIAKEASPERAAEAAGKLEGISTHCKEPYEVSSSYMERAKCRNLYESIDNVIKILLGAGFCNEIVGSFFGLIDSARGVSFSEVSAGRASIKKADIPEMPVAPVAPATPVEPAAPVAPASAELRMPPPPTPAANEPEAPVPVAPAAPAPVAEEPVYAPAKEDPEAPRDAASVLNPESFDDFIGQAHIIKALREEIAAAKIQGIKHLDNILLFGNRGLGKSTLMKLIAKELGVRFEFIDCSTFMNDVKSQRLFHEFFVRISKLDEPVVIALDEIHALPTRLQSALLTLLNDRVYSYVTESGTKNVPIRDFTFLGATTDYDAVLPTLKDRCSNLTFFMKDYTRDELSRIFRNKFRAMRLSLETDKIVEQCVNRCRSSIRDVNAIIKGLNTKAVNRNHGVVTMDMVDEYFADRGIDAIGLKDTEKRILEAIANEPRGSISEETLAARVYLDPAVLTSEHEPFLLKIGFISINSKGRSLTQAAEDYMRYGYFQYPDGHTVGAKPAADGEIKITAAPAAPVASEPAKPAEEPVLPPPPAPKTDPDGSDE